MDNKKKLIIGGGIAAAIIILIVLFVVFGKDDAKENETTTSAQSTSGVTEEITTLKENSTEATNEETSSEIVEESSDEETTSTVIEESSEDTTTKSEAVVDKETTTRKENSTTKKNETTTKKQVSKETTTKKQTTTAKQTTTKQETTTQEQTTAKPKPQSGRIKECELALIGKCIRYKPEGVGEDNIYENIAGKYNPYIEEREVFGWDNIAVASAGYNLYDDDDYFMQHYDNEMERKLKRVLYVSKKYNDALISDCKLWVEDSLKYDTVSQFSEYLRSRYSFGESNSFYNETRDDKWYDTWYYYDEYLQRYNNNIECYGIYSADIFVEDGYCTDVDKIMDSLIATKSENIKFSLFVFCRWIYDEKTDKTTIYIVNAM